jgi:hypothetical protein
MKLPQQIEGVQRTRHVEPIRFKGVEPAFLGGLGGLLGIGKKFACGQCHRLPGFLRRACEAACSL